MLAIVATLLLSVQAATDCNAYTAAGCTACVSADKVCGWNPAWGQKCYPNGKAASWYDAITGCGWS